MLKFCIISDNLLYEAMSLKVIFDCLKNSKQQYEIIDIENIPLVDDNTKIIYLVELDSKDNLYKALKHRRISDYVIVFTHYEHQAISLHQQHLLIDCFILKNKYYQNKLKDVLEILIKTPLKDENILILKQKETIIQIPKDDILYVTGYRNSTIIDAITNDGNRYQYVLNISKEKLLNQLKDDFIVVNKNLVVNKKQYDLSHHIDIKECNKKKKIYSKSYKEKVLKHYQEGYSSKELSMLYEPSLSTICRWIKEEKIAKEMSLLKNKANKFDKIESIVKE